MPQFVHSKPPVNFVDVVALYRLAQLMHSDRRCCDESTVSRCQCFVVIHSSPITIYGNAAHARSVEITATIFFFFFFRRQIFQQCMSFFFLSQSLRIGRQLSMDFMRIAAVAPLELWNIPFNTFVEFQPHSIGIGNFFGFCFCFLCTISH